MSPAADFFGVFGVHELFCAHSGVDANSRNCAVCRRARRLPARLQEAATRAPIFTRLRARAFDATRRARANYDDHNLHLLARHNSSSKSESEASARSLKIRAHLREARNYAFALLRAFCSGADGFPRARFLAGGSAQVRSRRRRWRRG